MSLPALQQPMPSADSLRMVLDSVFARPAYHWVERKDPLAFLRRWWTALADWLAALQTSHPDLYLLLLLALVGVLVAILVHAGFVFFRTVQAARAPADATGAAAGPLRDAAWYRREADRLAQAGHYALAMQADFLGLALELDGRQVLRFHPSKTPAEYAREARLAPPAALEFRELVRWLYRVAFAGAPAGPQEFAAWRVQSEAERYAPAH